MQQWFGTTRTIDPWGGSAYVERLTYELANKAWGLIEEVEAAGGMTQAINEGLPKLRIEESAARTQARIDSGQQPLVGVNKYQVDEDQDIEVLKVENSRVRAEQLAKLEAQHAFGDSAGTGAGRNWAHVNSVDHDPVDDSLILSSRHQSAVVKIGRDKQVKWILAAPNGWRDGLKDKVLTPVGKDGRRMRPGLGCNTRHIPALTDA